MFRRLVLRWQDYRLTGDLLNSHVGVCFGHCFFFGADVLYPVWPGSDRVYLRSLFFIIPSLNAEVHVLIFVDDLVIASQMLI